MPAPQTLLPWLLGGAIGAAGILQGLHWKAIHPTADSTALESRIRVLGEENEALKREHEALRSLAHGGGELAVPPEFIARVETEFGLRFRSSPVVHRATAEALRDRIGAAIESQLGPSGVDDRQQCGALIGWLRPDDELLTQLTAVRAVGAGGWFDEGTGEGWMLDKADLNNIPDQATLVRLLARMLFHQHFSPAPAYPGDEAARAREALHEGAAVGAETRFYSEKARSVGFIPMTGTKEFKQLLASLSPFLQGLTRFPAIEGKGYADSLFMRGNQALHAAFRSPPQTTHAILSPGASNAAPAALDLPATPEEPLLTESAGQLGLRLWLAPLGDAGAASEIAAAWRNDRYVLFPDGESSTALLWDIQLDSAEATDRLQACALQLATAMRDRKPPASAAEGAVAPGNRHLRIARISPTRIRFVNTAEAETAVKTSGG